MRSLPIHAIEPRSVANGPGERFVIWTQGCPFNCIGCTNPETHEMLSPTNHGPCHLFTAIVKTRGIEGITISGGEPLLPRNLPALQSLINLIRSHTGLTVLVFTGYEASEMSNEQLSLCLQCDVVISGRYRQDMACERGLLASHNQTIWYPTGRYTPEDIESVPEAEILIDEDGHVTATGIVPIALPQPLDLTDHILRTVA